MGLMARKPIVLLAMGAMWPNASANGPVRSCLNLVEALAAEYDFRIIARDRPSGTGLQEVSVGTGVWLDQGKYRALYARPENFTPPYFRRLLLGTPHDLLQLNGFFDREFTIPILVGRRFAGRARCPVILAPRGEFSQEALQLKRRRKRLYLMWGRTFGLLDSVWLQATTEREREDIRSALPGYKHIVVAPNIPTRVEVKRTSRRKLKRKKKGHVKLVFVGRISPMKNLDFALMVLSTVRSAVHYDIIGPVEDENLWRRCQELIRAMPAHIKVRLNGTASQGEVRANLQDADALFLPTRGENYGHAIVEALSEGTPVIISNQTPWNAVTSQGAGWALPLDKLEPFATAIEELANMDCAAWTAMSAAARRFSEAHFSYEAAVAATRAAFTNVLEHFHGRYRYPEFTM
jgi:glycosyltransferase involved in cell wall biosynthesis